MWITGIRGIHWVAVASSSSSYRSTTKAICGSIVKQIITRFNWYKIYFNQLIVNLIINYLTIYKKGPDCCSNETISMHQTTDGHLLEYEYLIYHLTIDQKQRHPLINKNRTKTSGNKRLLCWVNSKSPAEMFEERSELIEKTWGRRCDTLLFIKGQRLAPLFT